MPTESLHQKGLERFQKLFVVDYLGKGKTITVLNYALLLNRAKTDLQEIVQNCIKKNVPPKIEKNKNNNIFQ